MWMSIASKSSLKNENPKRAVSAKKDGFERETILHHFYDPSDLIGRHLHFIPEKPKPKRLILMKIK